MSNQLVNSLRKLRGEDEPDLATLVTAAEQRLQMTREIAAIRGNYEDSKQITSNDEAVLGIKISDAEEAFYGGALAAFEMRLKNLKAAIASKADA